MTKERSMLIQMDPHVAAAFHASSAVSRKLPIYMALLECLLIVVSP